MNALRLGNDRVQRLARRILGVRREEIRFMSEHVLGLSGNDRQRIVDLVPGPGGEFRQSGQLGRTQPFPLAAHLLAQGRVQFVHLSLQTRKDRRLSQPAIVDRHRQQLAQQRLTVRVRPVERRTSRLVGKQVFRSQTRNPYPNNGLVFGD